MDLPTAFGSELRKLRKAKGWSQMKLAMEAGLHLNALGHLERGERTPSLHTVFVLCRALKVPVAELVSSVEKARPQLSA